MFSPTPSALAKLGLRLAIGAVVLTLAAVTLAGIGAQAQGLVKGVQQGAQAGNKAAGPVGGVLGGAIGGVVGVFTGVLGTGNNQQQGQQPAANSKQPDSSKQPGSTKTASKPAKGEKAEKPVKQAAVMTQDGAPALTAEQIVNNSDANIERIKKELELTPEQEKNWYAFNSAMHYLGHNGADRLNLRIARAAEPLYSSLNDKQKQIFIDEMVNLSHERGLD